MNLFLNVKRRGMGQRDRSSPAHLYRAKLIADRDRDCAARTPLQSASSLLPALPPETRQSEDFGVCRCAGAHEIRHFESESLILHVRANARMRFCDPAELRFPI